MLNNVKLTAFRQAVLLQMACVLGARWQKASCIHSTNPKVGGER